MFTHSLSFIYKIVLTVVMLVTTAYAQAGKDPFTDQKHPLISSVLTDLSVGELYIHGKNFTIHSNLRVSLGGTELVVISADDELIKAWLPAGITAGDYLLLASMGKGNSKKPNVTFSTSYNLTIGAVGEQGPQGDKGPMGLQGPKGEPGTNGINLLFIGQSCPPGEYVVGFTDATALICKP